MVLLPINSSPPFVFLRILTIETLPWRLGPSNGFEEGAFGRFQKLRSLRECTKRVFKPENYKTFFLTEICPKNINVDALTNYISHTAVNSPV